MISEFNKWFNNNNPILKGIGFLNLIISMFLDMENIRPLSFYYDIDSDSLVTELKLLPNLIKINKKNKWSWSNNNLWSYNCIMYTY